jgi:hypothetical protein
VSQFFENVRQDLQFAFRNLGKRPGFRRRSLSPAFLPPEQLVVIWDTEPGKPDALQPAAIAELNDWLAANHSFQDIALTTGNEDSIMAGIGAAQHIDTQDVTRNYFSLTGTKPQMGRIFFAEEMQDKSIAVVLSDNFWRTKFNADPDVLGARYGPARRRRTHDRYRNAREIPSISASIRATFWPPT